MSLPPQQPWSHQSYTINSSWPQVEAPAQRSIPLIHIVLFFLTLGTTTLAGAVQQGVNPFTNPAALFVGLPFAVTLMSILLFHEMGHYLMARSHGVRASLPYFIPGPPFFVGTFGAFIRMKSLPINRSILFDVGAAGPWAGVMLAIPAVMIGLSLSEVRPLAPFEGGILLGDSFLFSALTRLVLGMSADDATVILHPVALAGWFGLFVTFLNLLPVGQLDGGHVTYSLFGNRHRWIARIFLGVIVLLGLQGWPGWFVWVVLIAMLGVDHPPTLDRITVLDPRRKLYAWCTIGLFAATFMPAPILLSEEPVIPDAQTTQVVYRPEHLPNTQDAQQTALFFYRP